MQIPLIGQSYPSAVPEVNNQACINMFSINAGPQGRGKAPLIPTGGLELKYQIEGTSGIRGMISIGDDTIFIAYNTKLYRLTVDIPSKEVTEIEEAGTLETSTGIVKMAENPTQLMIVDGEKGYIYKFSDKTFATIDDPDFIANPNNVVFLNGYFIVSQAGTGYIQTSALADGTDWDAVEKATAESNTDEIIALGVSKGDLWILGKHSIELWYTPVDLPVDGNNDPIPGIPLRPRRGLERQIGCVARNSVASIDDTLFWLDDRGFIVRSDVSSFQRDSNTGFDSSIISTEAITNEILSYARIDDAIAMSYNYKGHLMYQITFPSVDKTWVYDTNTGLWHERSFFDETAQLPKAHRAQFSVQVGNLTFMGGIYSGKLFLHHDKYYYDDDVVIRRTLRIYPLYDELNLRGVGRVELKVSTDDVPISGEGSSPKITLKYSTNGTRTWSSEIVRDLGKTGEYGKSISWNRLGTAREWVFEWNMADPIFFSIIDGYLDLDE